MGDTRGVARLGMPRELIAKCINILGIFINDFQNAEGHVSMRTKDMDNQALHVWGIRLHGLPKCHHAPWLLSLLWSKPTVTASVHV